MTNGRSDVVDVEVDVHHMTERAVLVSRTDTRRPPVWVPLSLVELEPKARDVSVMTIPRNFAETKGLL